MAWIIAGVLQGLLEWIPVSSSGQLLIVLKLLLGDSPFLYDYIMFLHLGTMLALVVRFREDLMGIMACLPEAFGRGGKRRCARDAELLLIATVFTALTGFPAYVLAESLSLYPAKMLLLFIGMLLIITALITSREPVGDSRQLSRLDSAILGLAQGLSGLPGLSRSGITISALLLRRIKQEVAVRWSYLASVPAIVGALVLSILYTRPVISLQILLPGLASSFVSGYASLSLMLDLSRKMNFSQFTLLVGALSLLSSALV